MMALASPLFKLESLGVSASLRRSPQVFRKFKRGRTLVSCPISTLGNSERVDYVGMNFKRL